MTEEELNARFNHINELAEKYQQETKEKIENLISDAFFAGYEAAEKDLGAKQWFIHKQNRVFLKNTGKQT